jgi:AcrR family transcriptional regulator
MSGNGVRMGIRERQERQKEMLRQEILDAARDLFIKEGYESVSMRKIAEKIEYSPTTIYLYFKDKADLFNQLCEESFAKLVKTFEELGEDLSNPIAALNKCGRAYIEFGLKNPNHYRVTFMLNLGSDAAKKKHLQEDSMGAKSFGYLRMIVGECVRQNKFREVDVETTSQALWSGVHGVTSLLIVHPYFPWVDKERLIDFTLDMMIQGLKA